MMCFCQICDCPRMAVRGTMRLVVAPTGSMAPLLRHSMQVANDAPLLFFAQLGTTPSTNSSSTTTTNQAEEGAHHVQEVVQHRRGLRGMGAGGEAEEGGQRVLEAVAGPHMPAVLSRRDGKGRLLLSTTETALGRASPTSSATAPAAASTPEASLPHPLSAVHLPQLPLEPLQAPVPLPGLRGHFSALVPPGAKAEQAGAAGEAAAAGGGPSAKEADWVVPPNVHMVTLQRLGPNKVLVRLAHNFQASGAGGAGGVQVR